MINVSQIQIAPCNMKKFIFLPALFIVMLSSCKKNELGGTSTIKGTVMHHSKLITKASVFIKFNAKEFPGADTTKYDEKVRVDANGSYSFKCYKGDYYLYSFGYDYGIPAPYEVIGGAPVHIRKNESVEINLAVSED